jgi:hypothetical protein
MTNSPPDELDRQLELLQLLAARLERLSADSSWARRASGLRGNMLKVLEEAASGQFVEGARLNLLIERGFEILRQAAREIPDRDGSVGQRMRSE